ncbi:MAG: alpha-galactosidase [Parasporobacterium sp.]|nr:alpha-galactosidase [Parasporobacterium sp.]
MSIIVNGSGTLFTLKTLHSVYQMKVDDRGFLRHLYYGNEIGEEDMSFMHVDYDRSFSPNPNCAFPVRGYSLDVIPQEYTSCGLSDYRVSSFGVINGDGSSAAEFHFVSYEIRKGKYQIPAQPAVFDEGGESETLAITLEDPVTGLQIELLYGVFEAKDVITRAVRIINHTKEPIFLTKAGSMSIDFAYGTFDLIGFHGRHTLERVAERTPIEHNVKVIRSRRGQSSHQHNPFVILCGRDATEDFGECYGFMLVYSGNFRAEAEMDQFGSTRLTLGIEPENFRWKLEPEEVFDTPEVILSYSSRGLAQLSRNYHRIIRQNIIRSKYRYARRPVLLNSWEGSYFDFDEKSLLKLAEGARDLGADLFVLDDGWFGVRNDDNSSLGDWFVNEDKIKGGLPALVAKVNDLGLKFGIWVEPEMVNEDSDLFREHPDWALQIPGRGPVRGRNQLVLNMSKPEVRDHIFNMISKVLKESNIEYVKWDVNRNVADLYNEQLSPDRQGEVAHRHILGVYELLERFVTAFPDILFEGCSGGGGRFDAAMMYYYPQIWCSDDTDAIPRLAIQHGTSFGYPISTIGAHVSASPNHQTGRITPINTRAVVAMNGTFGYELDPAKLTEEEKTQVREQIRFFKEHYELIQNGSYYRLTGIGESYFEAWEQASEDQGEALLSIVITDTQPNAQLIHVKLKGLDPAARYSMEVHADVDERILAIPDYPGTSQLKEFLDQEGRSYQGAALMSGGVTIPWIMGNYPALQLYFKKAE